MDRFCDPEAGGIWFLSVVTGPMLSRYTISISKTGLIVLRRRENSDARCSASCRPYSTGHIVLYTFLVVREGGYDAVLPRER